jgi:2-hydroxychromene-2-carboxylate isomerase
MKHALEFYFDVGSPAAYLAWTVRSRETARKWYRPFLLGGVFHATGNRSPWRCRPRASTCGRPAAIRQPVGVPFAHKPHFPINTLT